MDEIKYKLNTNNSVLVVNAIDKLISTIKSKFKPAERQKLLLENEELKLLREKCSSKEPIVSLTACQGLLALVELGVLEIAHTMSTVVSLLPSAQNYSAIISTMMGLLIFDLKSQLVPGQPYKCPFAVKCPQHPFITMLERVKGMEDHVFAQMQALCTHPDYIVSSNSLELLRPVFFYLTCNPQQKGSVRPWQLLLSLPKTDAQCSLLLACLSCQQICNPTLIERAFSAYSAVTDAAIYQRDEEYVTALLPMLARVSNELTKHGRDPRPCYHLIERCVALGGARLRSAVGVTLHLLSANLPRTSALYLHDTFNLCLNIISKYDCASLSLNAFVAQSLQWLHLPSYLTTSALQVAAKILDTYRNNNEEDTVLNIPNLMSNKIFNSLLYTDSHLSVVVKLHSVWESLRDDETKLESWLNQIESIHDSVKVDLLPFFYGIIMEKNRYMERIVLKLLNLVVNLVDYKKDVAVELLPILVYKIANDKSPAVRFECLKAMPLMAKTKENLPTILSILNKLKTNKGVPTSTLIMLYTSLTETQVRCFPYLQELLVDPGAGRPDDLKWEVEIAKAMAVYRMCEIRASSYGLELVSLISHALSRGGGGGGGGAVVAQVSLRSVARLWRGAALAPHSAWRSLEPRLAADNRPPVQLQVCKLLSEIPPLQSPSPEFAALATSACRRLWSYVAESTPSVVEAACEALSKFSTEHYVLKDIPEIYRKNVKLPASYCKTPIDAARNPEDVLDYVPCEVWAEVFKYTNQAALSGVVTLVRGLMRREVRGFRSGVYHVAGAEPLALGLLPAHSAVRGVMEAFRKQVISPSYECPDVATLAMLEALSGDFPKPLPPLDLHFLAEVCAKGGEWRRGAVTLAAKQAKVSPSAKGVIENWVLCVQSKTVDDPDIILFYELLPVLTRTLPPNTLRGPLERTLTDAFAVISQTKAKQDYAETVLIQTLSKLSTPSSKSDSLSKESANLSSESDSLSKESATLSSESDSLSKESQPILMEEDSMFEKQLKLIKRCLDCDTIHEANRTLLSQLVEHYFDVISDDNIAWPTYVWTCPSLPTSHLERMTSPAGWWEESEARVRRAAAVRARVAAGGGGGGDTLVWLNEAVDAVAQHRTEQDSFLCYIFPALLAADPSAEASREWFLQLMARTQVAFKENKEMSAKRFLFSVLVSAVVTWSGHWALCAGGGGGGAGAVAGGAGAAGGGAGDERLPAAACALVARTDGAYTLQMLEWLLHTRDCIDAPAALWCQRTLLALRHSDHFAQRNVWSRLVSHFGNDIITEA